MLVVLVFLLVHFCKAKTQASTVACLLVVVSMATRSKRLAFATHTMSLWINKPGLCDGCILYLYSKCDRCPAPAIDTNNTIVHSSYVSRKRLVLLKGVLIFTAEKLPLRYSIAEHFPMTTAARRRHTYIIRNTSVENHFTLGSTMRKFALKNIKNLSHFHRTWEISIIQV